MMQDVPAGYLTARQIGQTIGLSDSAIHERAKVRGVTVLSVPPAEGWLFTLRRVYAAKDVPTLVAKLPRRAAPVRPARNGANREEIRQRHWAVVEAVARCYEMTPTEVVGRGRDPLQVEARRIAMQLLADRGLGATHIGYVVGKDHSTCLHHLSTLRDKPTEEEIIMLADCRKAVQQIGPS